VDGYLAKGLITGEDISDVGCGTNVASLFEAIQASKVYLNVHSVMNPGGEVRGQLGLFPAA